MAKSQPEHIDDRSPVRKALTDKDHIPNWSKNSLNRNWKKFSSEEKRLAFASGFKDGSK